MKKLSRPVIAVLVTLMTAILACLAFAVWMISAPEESAAPSRDFVVSFDLGEDYSKEDEDSTYHARAYSSSSTEGTRELTFGEGDNAIPDPTWADTTKTFGGWKTSPEDSNVYGSEALKATVTGALQTYTVASDVTFTAQWTSTATEKTYTITFNAENTDEAWTAQSWSGAEGATITLPTTQPVRTGYEFKGWILGTSDDAPLKEDTKLTATLIAKYFTGGETTVTLTAKWTAINYTIEFVDGGDHSVQTAAPTLSGTQTNVHIGDPITGLTMHTLEGYDFVEWQYTGGTITAAQEGTYKLDEALIGSAENVEGTMTITLTAQWKIKTFTVTFNKNNGTASTTEEIAWHSQVSFSGHEITGDYNDTRYIGWKLSTDTETKPTLYTALGTGNLPTNYTDTYAATTQSVYTVEGEVTFEAQWAQLYIVNLDKNGSSTSIADNVATQQGFYGQTVSEIPASLNKSVNGKTRTFIGWYHGETTKGDWTFGEYTDTDYAYTLTARWTMTVTIYFRNTFGWTIGSVSLLHKSGSSYVSYKTFTSDSAHTDTTWTAYKAMNVREDYYDDRELTVKFNSITKSGTSVKLSSSFTNNTTLTSEDDMRFIPCYNNATGKTGYYIDAYDSLSKVTVFKVHFYDELGWDTSTHDIYAYTFFVDSGKREHELFGPFEDKAMSLSLVGNWYTATIVAPTSAEDLAHPDSASGLTISFHDGVKNETTAPNPSQTQNIRIISDELWVAPVHQVISETMDASTSSKHNVQKVNTFTTEPTVVTTHFLLGSRLVDSNTSTNKDLFWHWNNVYAYAFYTTTEENSGTPLGPFVSTEIKSGSTPVMAKSEGDRWYSITFVAPTEELGKSVGVIFYNGRGDIALSQTENCMVSKAEEYFIPSGSQTTDWTPKIAVYSTTYTSASDANKVANASYVNVMVHFKNTSKWGTLYVYAYYGGSQTKLFGEWPGKTLWGSGAGDTWFTVTLSFPATSKSRYIIINNGDGNPQTKNISLSTSYSEFWISTTNTSTSTSDASSSRPTDYTQYWH